MAVTPTGLCGSCRHQRVIRSRRGSSFSMCERGLADPDWPKYPSLPVLRCSGHESRPRPSFCSGDEGE